MLILSLTLGRTDNDVGPYFLPTPRADERASLVDEYLELAASCLQCRFARNDPGARRPPAAKACVRYHQGLVGRSIERLADGPRKTCIRAPALEMRPPCVRP